MKHFSAPACALAIVMGLLLSGHSVAQGRVEQGTLILDGIPDGSPGDAARLGRWLESRAASLMDWQADGALLISTRFGNVAQLQEAIAFRKPGDVVEVEVARKGGARSTIRVPLQRAPTEKLASASTSDDDAPRRRASGSSSMPSLGIKVAPVDAEAARELQLPADVKGLVVMEVSETSTVAGRLATPQAGGPDVILSVEGTPVTTAESLRTALRSAKAGDIVSLRVYNALAKVRRVERVRLGSSESRS